METPLKQGVDGILATAGFLSVARLLKSLRPQPATRHSRPLFPDAKLTEDRVEQVFRRRFDAPSRLQVLANKFFWLDRLRFVASRFQHIEMIIFRDNKIRFSGNGAIAKFVVVRVN